MHLTLTGKGGIINYQIYTGQALGTYNQFIASTVI